MFYEALHQYNVVVMKNLNRIQNFQCFKTFLMYFQSFFFSCLID